MFLGPLALLKQAKIKAVKKKKKKQNIDKYTTPSMNSKHYFSYRSKDKLFSLQLETPSQFRGSSDVFNYRAKKKKQKKITYFHGDIMALSESTSFSIFSFF